MLDKPLILCLSLGPADAVSSGSFVTDDNRGRVFRKCVIRSGKFWKKGQPFQISQDEIKHFKSTVDYQLSKGIRIDVPSEHADGQYAPDRSRGKVVGAEVAQVETDSGPELGLYTFIEFASEDHAKLSKTAECSIYVPASYEVGTSGEVIHRPLREVALTQDPVVSGLGSFELVLSHGPPTMKMKDLAKALEVSFEDDADDTAIAREIKKAWKAKSKAEPTKLSQDPADPATPADPAKSPNVTDFNVSLLRKSRTTDIKALELSHHITPAQSEKLIAQHCSQAALELSLSNSTVLESFDDTVETLKLSVQSLGDGKDHSQHQTLELSKEDLRDPKKNPLSAACSGA